METYRCKCALCGRNIKFENRADFCEIRRIKRDTGKGFDVYIVCKQCSKEYDNIINNAKEKFFKEKEE